MFISKPSYAIVNLFKNSNALQNTCLQQPRRHFWYWLNQMWNVYDDKRVEEVGPNRAAAEWLTKCGAQVKFQKWGNYVDNFNKLPPGGFEAFKIEEIRAENACIMARGFEYLNGLKHVKSVKLINCELIDDVAIGKLAYLRPSLESLQIVFCPTVTDVGLSYLYLQKQLKDLYLNYLPGVKDRELALKLLRENLPNTTVEFNKEEVTPEETQKL